ncbi:hypothetical protein Tco_1472114 [Tanacetum coccineum]
MTKVIKGEFEKIKDVKVEGVSLTCDTPLEVFNNKVSRLCRMDDDSKHKADDDMGYDPSDVASTKWLGSKIFNYKTMDHITMKALWIYWIKGDDEVELIDYESSNVMDEVAENGQHVVGWMVDTVMEETYQELTLLETNSIIKITNGTRLWKNVNLKMRL